MYRHDQDTDGAKSSTVVKGPMIASIKCFLVGTEWGCGGALGDIWVSIRPKNNDLLVIRKDTKARTHASSWVALKFTEQYKRIDCLCGCWSLVKYDTCAKTTFTVVQ